MSDKGADWLKQLEELNAKKAARQQAEQPAPEVAASAAPAPAQLPADGVLTTFEVSAPEPVKTADNDLDTFIGELKGNILGVYRDFVGKMTPTVLPGQVESIKISCPVVGHEDKDPSAWVNIDNNRWYCARCGFGGDVLDMIAESWGWSDYKHNPSDRKKFHDLRREIAKRYGWVIENQNGFEVAISPQAAAQRQKEAEAQYLASRQQQPEYMVSLSPIEMGSSTASPQPLASVVSIETGEEVEEEVIDREAINRGLPVLEWNKLSKEGTFLDEYMKSAIVDDAPEEYHFFNGLMALGLAVGRNLHLPDRYPIYANLYVCNVGGTGLGKSMSVRALADTVRKALPWDVNDVTRQGVNFMSGVASGEKAITNLMGWTAPPKGQQPQATGRVKAYIRFDEFSDFANRASRQGSIIKDKIVIELSDNPDELVNDSKGTGQEVATFPFACFSTSVQPDVVRKLLTKDDAASGFLNRMLFITGRYRDQDAIGSTPVNMNNAAEMLKDINTWSLNASLMGDMKWSNEAADVFTKWFKGEWEPKKKANQLSDILARVPVYLKKFAMLFAVNEKSVVVTEEHMKRSMDLLPFVLHGYLLIDSKVTQSISSEMEQEILDFIESRQQDGVRWVSRSEIKRIKKKYDSDTLLRCLENLEKLGLITGQEGATNPGKNGRTGRPIKGRAYIPA